MGGGFDHPPGATTGTDAATARDAIARLDRLGIETVMATGDLRVVALHIARQIGIERVIARATPAMKLELIDELQRKRSAHPPLRTHDHSRFLSGNNSSMRLLGQEGSFSRVSISQAMGSMPFRRVVSSSD